MTQRARLLAVFFALFIAGFSTVSAQQLIRREIHRTPSGEILDFDANGAWRVKARRVAEHRRALLQRGDFGGLNARVSAAGVSSSPTAVTGTIRVPAILLRYTDVGTGAGNAAAAYQSLLYDATAPAGRAYSFRSFYGQLSDDQLTIDGSVIGWIQLAQPEASYTGGESCGGGLNPFGGAQCNGLFSAPASTARINGLKEALTLSDTADFSLYDNDGDDGVPNSGDDDGFVDLMMFFQSEQDGACFAPTNGHLWSHRSAFTNGGGTPFTTNDARSGGGFIRISSYILQSGVGGTSGCTAGSMMGIGTTSHEFGHALGLPDLYDTQGNSEGLGQWGLMSSGNYTTSNSPARMEAWSLNELGWVTLAPITTNNTYSFGPAPTSDSAFVLRVQGTNSFKEYYLLENRQAVQADTALIRFHCGSQYSGTGSVFPATCHGGLAIWHVDSIKIQNSQGSNTVNYSSGPTSPHGLILVQSDGLGDLERGTDRGDAGDLWPGYRGGLSLGNTVYSAGTNPKGAINRDSAGFVGFQIDQITQVVPDGEMSFRVTFGHKLQVTTIGNGAVTSNPTYLTAPNTLSGGAFVNPNTTPTVTLTATPTGNSTFINWTGTVTSTQNPLTVSMNQTHNIVANFTSPVAVSSTAPPAGSIGKAYSFQLTATGGTPGSYSWSVISGSLPTGLSLSTSGQITGTPSAAGNFSATVQVSSGGQTASGTVAIGVAEPSVVANSAITHLVGSSTALTPDEISYLDFLGNNNGSYDVGDFLSWVNRTNAGSVTITPSQNESGLP